MKHFFMTILLALAVFSTPASAINVKVNADPGINDKAVISRIEHNLSALLTEINSAKDADRPLSYEGLNVSAAAKETLNTLWVVAHFYCCDDEVTDRLWNFRKSYMVRSIPLIIATDGAYGDGTYQEAVVEFDKAGNISDFRFSFGSQLGETLEKCSKGDPVDTERKLEILSWCDRLRTAYNEHNLPFMQKIFSDKALIITGRVVEETNREFGTSTQKIVYSKQNKRQYMRNLANCFKNNKWIDVQFDDHPQNTRHDHRRQDSRYKGQPHSRNRKKSDVRTDHVDITVSEVNQFHNAVYHRISQGDQRVNTA